MKTTQQNSWNTLIIVLQENLYLYVPTLKHTHKEECVQINGLIIQLKNLKKK